MTDVETARPAPDDASWSSDDVEVERPRARRTRARTTARRESPAVAPGPGSSSLGAITRAEFGTVVNRGLLIFAVSVLAFAFFLYTPSALQHGRSQAGLTRRFRAELATQRAPVEGIIPAGAPVAMLEISAIGVHEIVVQGDSSGLTRAGPGHLSASVLPGQLGNSVIVGRRWAYGGPFRHLPSLRAGDEIRVTTGQGTSRYSVVSEGPEPAGSAKPMFSSSEGRLTLVTSDPVLLANRYRVAVAKLVSTPFAATGHASTVARADLGLTGDPSAAATVFVWLLFAALVGAGVVVARRRMGRASTWLLFVPLLLAAAWLVFDNVVVLLPASL